jgi:CheY-like chemotaxis protein/anti-sigma regulatory factor (Ser/Thr protein kinase)
MSRILVVEDSRTQGSVLKQVLESHGFEATVVSDGQAALEAIQRQPPHVVLTDLLMPGMNGLELVEQVRKRFPRVPTVLITEFGSEEIAAEALHRGAAGYIPKRRLQTDLVRSLERVLGIAKANPRHQKLIDGITSNELRFELDNDLSVLPHLVSHLQDCVGLMHLCDETAQLRLGIALSEALTNAVYHGNLELSSDERNGEGRNWFEFAIRRADELPYRDRKVYVQASLTRDQAQFVIRDEGPGFDPRSLPDPRDPANLAKASGRGLLLIHCFLDEVQHNAVGNEITLIKRRDVA